MNKLSYLWILYPFICYPLLKFVQIQSNNLGNPIESDQLNLIFFIGWIIAPAGYLLVIMITLGVIIATFLSLVPNIF